MFEEAVPFGEMLRRLREAAGLTQEGLAEKAGLSVQGIAALERGRSRRPYPHTVRALAEALSLSREDQAALLAAIPQRGQRDDDSPAPPGRSDVLRLPPAGAPLLGREHALADIEALISRGVRLVTVTGPGGVGKTSLALHAATALNDGFPDGACFISLASLTDPEYFLPTIVQALRLPGSGTSPAIDTLRSSLQDARMLMVLDNLEQIIDVAPDVSRLLQECDNLVMLATSRAPLRIRAEREYPLQPLEVPELDHIPHVDEVAGAAAVELFVQRAQEANPSFRLAQDNAAAVAAICRRLDGLPLAIELAAARLRLLTPMELLARLDSALPMLSGGARDLPERQRTMTRAIEWSYDLLSAPERQLFERLSVFRGGWTIDAAEAIGATLDDQDSDVLSLLGSLVEQSLVAVSTLDTAQTRYRLLVPIREFAAARLEESGQTCLAREAHASYILRLSNEAASGLEGPRQVEWLARLELERSNLRAAIEWLIDHDKLDELSRIVWNLWIFLWIRGNHTEAGSWLARISDENSDAPAIVRARAAGVAAAMVFALGNIPEAIRLAHASQDGFLSAGDDVSAARTRLVLGMIASATGDGPAAMRWLELAATSARSDQAWFWAALSTIARGMVPFREGNYGEAESILDEGYTLSRAAGDRFSRYIVLYDMSRLAQARGELGKAVQLFQEGFTFSLEVGDRANMAYCLEGLASVAVMHHDPHLAARLLGRAETLFEAAGARVYTYRPDSSLRESTLASVRAQLEPDVFAFEWREGAQMSFDDLLDLALPLGDTGRRAEEPAIQVDNGGPDTALRSTYGLTRRELEILRLLMNHYSYREISDELFISPRTVGTHVTSINRKMGVSSRQEAAAIASQHGLG
jgi:predicted ATPase/DNA-binding CsgD family transcriptional regulator/transcriptional regulator with XRE-family HTH domain